MHFPTFCNKSRLITHILLCWKILFYVKSISNCCCIPWQDWNELQTFINWNILGLKQCALQTQTVSKYHILAACIQDHLEDMASVWWGLLTVSLTGQAKMIWCEIVCGTMGIFLGFGVDSSHQKGTSTVIQPSVNKLVGMMWACTELHSVVVSTADVLHPYSCAHLSFISLGGSFHWASKLNMS